MKRQLLVLTTLETECGNELCLECTMWVPTDEGRFCMATNEHIENGYRTVGCHKAEKEAKRRVKA